MTGTRTTVTATTGPEQRGTVLLLPVAAARPRSIEYSWRDLPQLLNPGLHLLVDWEERCLTLGWGRQVLVQAILRPVAFRSFLALLLTHQQGKTCRHAMLLALHAASEEQVASLLGDNPQLAWFRAATEAQDQVLQHAQERKRLLKSLSRAIREPGGLGPVLAAHGFGWEVQSRYGRGYRLARIV